jgi:hypothetical protein
LVAVLDPNVVLRVDYGAVPAGATPAGATEVRGARAVAEQALLFSRLAASARPVLVNGSVGIVTVVDGRAVSAWD